MNKSNLTEQFVEKIETLILTDEWKTGEKIPTLRALAEQFGVSRSVVNAGIAELEEKGYLKSYPRQRTVVADWRREGTLSVINAIIKYGIDNENITRSVFDSRMLIETEAARLAALNRDAEDLIELENILKAEKSSTAEKMPSLDVEFHRAILIACKNTVFLIVMNGFKDIYRQLVEKFYSGSPENIKYVIDGHSKLFKAVRDGDSERSALLMTQLLEHGRKHTLNY